MIRNHEVLGEINKAGKIEFYGLNQRNDFLSQHKNKTVIINYRVLPDGGKEKMLGYINHFIVEEFQKGFLKNGEIYNKERTEFKIRELCSFTKVGNNIKEFEELSYEELHVTIMELKQIGAERFSLFIHDPKEL